MSKYICLNNGTFSIDDKNASNQENIEKLKDFKLIVPSINNFKNVIQASSDMLVKAISKTRTIEEAANLDLIDASILLVPFCKIDYEFEVTYNYKKYRKEQVPYTAYETRTRQIRDPRGGYYDQARKNPVMVQERYQVPVTKYRTVSHYEGNGNGSSNGSRAGNSALSVKEEIIQESDFKFILKDYKNSFFGKNKVNKMKLSSYSSCSDINKFLEDFSKSFSINKSHIGVIEVNNNVKELFNKNKEEIINNLKKEIDNSENSRNTLSCENFEYSFGEFRLKPTFILIPYIVNVYSHNNIPAKNNIYYCAKNLHGENDPIKNNSVRIIKFPITNSIAKSYSLDYRFLKLLIVYLLSFSCTILIRFLAAIFGISSSPTFPMFIFAIILIFVVSFVNNFSKNITAKNNVLQKKIKLVKNFKLSDIFSSILSLKVEIPKNKNKTISIPLLKVISKNKNFPIIIIQKKNIKAFNLLILLAMILPFIQWMIFQ